VKLRGANNVLLHAIIAIAVAIVGVSACMSVIDKAWFILMVW